MDFFERQDAARRKTRWLVLACSCVAVGADRGPSAGGRHRPCAASARRRHAARPRSAGSRWSLSELLRARWPSSAAPACTRLSRCARGGGAVARSLGGAPVDPQHARPGTSGGCSTWSRRWRSPRACPCRRSTCSRTRTASTPSPPAIARATPPSPSRAARSTLLNRDELQGVIGARVQPHPQRRHAAEPAPDRRACSASWSSRSWRASCCELAAQQRPRAGAMAPAPSCWPRWPSWSRLHRRVLRPPDPGRGVAPARVPRGRLGGAVHAQSRTGSPARC